jgi:hypothetical protein
MWGWSRWEFSKQDVEGAQLLKSMLLARVDPEERKGLNDQSKVNGWNGKREERLWDQEDSSRE